MHINEICGNSVIRCINDHVMVASSYQYAGGTWYCDLCGLHRNDRRWFCLQCKSDFCFDCVPVVFDCTPMIDIVCKDLKLLTIHSNEVVKKRAKRMLHNYLTIDKNI